MTSPVDLHPTLFFGFHLNKGKEVLHQLWMDEFGTQDWRPVPMIVMGERPPALVIEGDKVDERDD